jgi:transcriptional regulator with XRE-family HTH domain
MISGAQIRAARALLGWTAKDLAQKAKVGVSTVQRIQSALEAAGIEFTNGDVPGIRFHQKLAGK